MLTGLSPWTAPGQPAPPKPDTVNYFFLEQGHVMEYFRFGPADKKIVSLFFGPGEFVLPSHLHFSCFGMLDEVVTDPLTYGTVIRALRNYGDADKQYRKIQQRYRQKVASRMIMRYSLTASEQYAALKATQPWVLDLAAEDDVANYLGVSVGMLGRLRKGESSLY